MSGIITASAVRFNELSATHDGYTLLYKDNKVCRSDVKLSVIVMQDTFYNCINVESGILALYQQVSTQSNIPYHSEAFYNCGSNTETGRAELAQLPSDWK